MVTNRPQADLGVTPRKAIVFSTGADGLDFPSQVGTSRMSQEICDLRYMKSVTYVTEIRFSRP